MKEIENYVKLHASTHRRSLEHRSPIFGLSGFDMASSAITTIARTFEARAAKAHADRKAERLGARGLDEELEAAAVAAGENLRALETTGAIGGYRHHLDTLRTELFAPEPSPDAGKAATVADVLAATDRAWVRAEVFRQIARMTLPERNLMAQNVTDPDVAAVLNAGPPVVRTRNGVAFVEPLIGPEVKEAAALAKARTSKPDVALRFDEITEQVGAIEAVLGAAKSRIGEAVRSPFDNRSGAAVLDGGTSVKVVGAGGLVDADTLPAQPVVGERRPMVLHGPEGEAEA